jgi:hypothetical protein
MKTVVVLIGMALSVCNCVADELRTWTAILKDKEGCELQIKSHSSDDELLQEIQQLKKLGFSLRSFTAVDDGANAKDGQYAFRFVCYCKGRYKDGSSFVEGTGGVAKSLLDALEAARKKPADLRKEIEKEGNSEVVTGSSGPLLELEKIVIMHEPWESWKGDAPEGGDRGPESKSKQDAPSE